jgi:hypothetical protein
MNTETNLSTTESVIPFSHEEGPEEGCVSTCTDDLIISIATVDSKPILSIKPMGDMCHKVHDGWIELNGWYSNDGVNTALSVEDGTELGSLTITEREGYYSVDNRFVHHMNNVFSSGYTERYRPVYHQVDGGNYRHTWKNRSFENYIFPEDLLTLDILEFKKTFELDFSFHWSPFDKRKEWDSLTSETPFRFQKTNYYNNEYDVCVWASRRQKNTVMYYIISDENNVVVATIRDNTTAFQEGDGSSGYYMFKNGNILLTNNGDVSSCILFENNKIE